MAAVLFQLKVEFILPPSIRNAIADMSEVLACVNGMAGPARAAASLSIDVYIMQIELAVSELGHTRAVSGRDQIGPMTVET